MKLKGRGHCAYCDVPNVHIATTVEKERTGDAEDHAMCDVCYELGTSGYKLGGEPVTVHHLSYVVRLILAKLEGK